jgi:hypothetical protein
MSVKTVLATCDDTLEPWMPDDTLLNELARRIKLRR